MNETYNSIIHDDDHNDDHNVPHLAAMAYPNNDEVIIQARELAFMQTEPLNRDARLAGMDRRDGTVVSGAAPSFHEIDGDETHLEARFSAHKIYARGDVFSLPAQTLIVPVQDDLIIGLRLTRSVVKPTDNPSIRGNTPNTEAFGRDGADRITITPSWGYEGDGIIAPLYPVYTTKDGVIQQSPSEVDYSWLESDRRYDRATNGERGYVTNGLGVIAHGLSGTDQVFTIQGGKVTVFGWRQERSTDTILHVEELPDLLQVTDESHEFADAGDGTCTIRLNRTPIAAIEDVTITKQRTAQVTRSNTGNIDPIDQTSIFNIVSISHGATTYTKDVDWRRSGDNVEWLTANRPDPDENYDAVIQYREKIVPEIVDRFHIKVSGGLDGAEVLFDYSSKLPRIDAITINRLGDLNYLRGDSVLSAPRQPATPSDELPLAYIVNDWGALPTVRDARIMSKSYQQAAATEALILRLLDNQNRLFSLVNIVATEPGKIRHSFIDHATNHNQRDEGLAQTASISDGAIRLGEVFTEYRIAHTITMLPFVHEVIASNLLATSNHKINPYQSLTRMPAFMDLTPRADLWSDRRTVWGTPEVEDVVTGSGDVVAEVDLQANIEVVSETQITAEFVRERTLTCAIDGFAAGETLAELSFGGTDLPLPDPAPVADANGRLTFTFDIPGGIPAGRKEVAVKGSADTPASAVYVAEGVTTVEELRLAATLSTARTQATVTNITNITNNIVQVTQRSSGGGNGASNDPQAQSFTTSEPRMISGVRWPLTVVGNTDNPVLVQLRGMDDGGQPNWQAFAEDLVSGEDLSIGWKDTHFEAPVFNDTNQRRAFAWLTADDSHALSKAVMGELDETGKLVGAKPFEGSTNFDGADNTTWLAHPDRDITMEILAAKFTATSLTVDLTTLENVTLTGLQVRAGVDTPGIGTSLDFIAVEEDGTEHVLTPNVFRHLGKRISNQDVQIKARLRGTEHVSPALFGDIQIICSNQIDASTYIGRRMTIDSDSKLRAVIKAHIPNGASVTPKIGAPDNWQAMTADGAPTPAGNDFFEFKYVLTGYTEQDARLLLELQGTPEARPTVDSVWVTDLYAGV